MAGAGRPQPAAGPAGRLVARGSLRTAGAADFASSLARVDDDG